SATSPLLLPLISDARSPSPTAISTAPEQLVLCPSPSTPCHLAAATTRSGGRGTDPFVPTADRPLLPGAAPSTGRSLMPLPPASPGRRPSLAELAAAPIGHALAFLHYCHCTPRPNVLVSPSSIKLTVYVYHRRGFFNKFGYITKICTTTRIRRVRLLT
uniref:Uncharacterized protein n=1 Tax=Triticum urartu TaxID=4572 RepID=A0A8R7PRE2_TRIUA